MNTLWPIVGVLVGWGFGIAGITYFMRGACSEEDTSTPRSTKQCPECGNADLVHISTHRVKFCTDCNIRIEWVKDKGQSDYYA